VLQAASHSLSSIHPVRRAVILQTPVSTKLNDIGRPVPAGLFCTLLATARESSLLEISYSRRTVALFSAIFPHFCLLCGFLLRLFNRSFPPLIPKRIILPVTLEHPPNPLLAGSPLPVLRVFSFHSCSKIPYLVLGFSQ